MSRDKFTSWSSIVFNKKDIDAVKLILQCFLDEPENNVKRNKLIRRKVAENEDVKTYGRFSEAELKEQLRFLQGQGSGEWLLVINI